FRITAHNRGRDRAPLHVIPQLWFRNTWSWNGEDVKTPFIRAEGSRYLFADDTDAPPLAGLLHKTQVGPRILDLPSGSQRLFTDNETNAPRVYGDSARSRSPFVKDAFHRRIVGGDRDAENPANTGTKACGWMRFEIDGG